jgi:hypothetical protein
MYKILIPEKEKKSLIRGIWKDGNKLYFDNLKAEYTDYLSYAKLDKLCEDYNQLAIFYTFNNTASIYTKKSGRIDKLLKRSINYCSNKKDLKSIIKEYILKFGGATVYIESKASYKIIGYYND